MNDQQYYWVKGYADGYMQKYPKATREEAELEALKAYLQSNSKNYIKEVG